MGQLGQHQQPAAALHQRAHGAEVAGTLDQVSLPVTRKLTLVDLWRAHMDAQQIGNLASAVRAA
jgi:hypothetical protein